MFWTIKSTLLFLHILLTFFFFFSLNGLDWDSSHILEIPPLTLAYKHRPYKEPRMPYSYPVHKRLCYLWPFLKPVMNWNWSSNCLQQRENGLSETWIPTGLWAHQHFLCSTGTNLSWLINIYKGWFDATHQRNCGFIMPPTTTIKTDFQEH